MIEQNTNEIKTKRTIYYWPDGFWTEDKDMAEVADKHQVFGPEGHQALDISIDQLPEIEAKFAAGIIDEDEKNRAYAQINSTAEKAA